MWECIMQAYHLLLCLISRFFLGGDGGSIFYLFILISDFKGTFEEEKSGELLVNSLEERMFCSTKVLLAMLKLYTYTQTMQNVYVVLFFFIIIVFCFLLFLYQIFTFTRYIRRLSNTIRWIRKNFPRFSRKTRTQVDSGSVAR